MRTWKRNGYEIKEIGFQFNLNEFAVVKNGGTIAIITPETISDMDAFIAEFDNGECPDRWEDGQGNRIKIYF